MRLLLDTHVLLWALWEPDRIPAATAAMLRNPENELVVSAVTPLEIATKHRIGKLPAAAPLLLAFEDHLRRLGTSDLPITGHHGLIAGQLPWNHRDPFDRILAAQAITESISLVTSDEVFASVGGVRTVWG